MTDLQAMIETRVRNGSLPGAVAVVASGERLEVQAIGSLGLDHPGPMTRDAIFRIASITKPIVAAAAMLLVEDGNIGLSDPVANWLPELSSPRVVRTPDSPVDDVVPARRPVTLFDLLTSRPGWGFPADFSLPAIQMLFNVQKDGRAPHLFEPPHEWLTALAKVPMVSQPGERFLYGTSFDVLGVLIARLTDQTLGDVLAERLFDPLGMVDTGFAVPESKLDRFARYYLPDPDGALQPADTQAVWTRLPVFESGGGGLLGTADDWLRFARMLLADGRVEGRQLLAPASVRQMLTNHLDEAQRASARLFLEGQGWGFGGSVDVAPTQRWEVPGRYGWVGGSGTSAHLIPSTGTVAILLTQVGVTSPAPVPLQLEFWSYAAAS
ncbi:MAG TPA: serine hydrolase domain-containing protein [Acidimicrobiales bacterium]|nr:serine hydrolase domain-containing protein [Acidimicrobiales bacterium]